MNKVRPIALLLVAILIAALCGVAGSREPVADNPPHRVPYRMSETLHMVVRAKFNGKGPFNFIVDTGAPTLFVTTELAKEVGVEPARNGWATFDRVELEGGATLEAVKARVEDIFQIKGMNGLGLAGVKLDGVLGYSVLARFRMEFDLSKSWMTWTELDFDPPLPRPLLGDGAGETASPPGFKAIGGLMQLAGALLGRSTTDPVTPRGFLGIELADVDGSVRIRSVIPQSPADEAGLKPGDTLIKFAGKRVGSTAQLLEAAATIGPDEEIRLLTKRDGSSRELTAHTGKGF